jgi:hypothetical protein
MKAMHWGRGHTDIYTYRPSQKLWIKVQCRLKDEGMNCTAPYTLPRGTKFSYNVKVTNKLRLALL